MTNYHRNKMCKTHTLGLSPQVHFLLMLHTHQLNVLTSHSLSFAMISEIHPSKDSHLTNKLTWSDSLPPQYEPE